MEYYKTTNRHIYILVVPMESTFNLSPHQENDVGELIFQLVEMLLAMEDDNKKRVEESL